MTSIQFKCPHCNQSIESPIEMLGQLMDCPSCSQTVEVLMPPKRPPSAPLPLHHIVPKLKLPKPPRPPKKGFKGKEYKVLTQKYKCFAEGFSPETLEQAMNAYAAKGWRVISVVTARFPSVPEGTQEELIVVLGRDK